MAVLELDDGSKVTDPTATQINEILNQLWPPKSYAILSRTDDTYLQTKPTGHNKFRVEYQDGSLDEHYEASVAASVSQVISALQSYQRGGESWKSAFHWLKLDLTGTSRPIYPAPDRSQFVPNKTKTAENDQLDVGAGPDNEPHALLLDDWFGASDVRGTGHSSTTTYRCCRTRRSPVEGRCGSSGSPVRAN